MREQGQLGNYTVYPEQGTFCLGNDYAIKAALTVEVYKSNGAEQDTSKKVDPTADRGVSSAPGSMDKALVSVAMTRQEMAAESFAETLNANIRTIGGVLEAYGISAIALREWKLDGGRVLSTGPI